MSTLPMLLLKEYRCDCDKLLFKGALFLSTVEVKCKRCGSVKTFNDSARGHITFTLFVDRNGRLSDTCRMAEALGIERSYYLNKPVTDIFPLLRDSPFAGASSEAYEGIYQIPHGTLVLKDGLSFDVESIVVPRYQDGIFDGLRIFSVPHQQP